MSQLKKSTRQIGGIVKYTEKIHAEGLLEIFSQEKPCGHCPAQQKWPTLGPWTNYYCQVCLDFIGVSYEYCPCHNGNAEKSAKLTWLALEAKGYLE